MADIISLHEQGVDESVITAMQQAPTAAARVAPAAPIRERVVVPAPVIVEEHYVVPHFYPPRPRYRHYHHHHHGIHLRF